MSFCEFCELGAPGESCEFCEYRSRVKRRAVHNAMLAPQSAGVRGARCARGLGCDFYPVPAGCFRGVEGRVGLTQNVVGLGVIVGEG